MCRWKQRKEQVGVGVRGEAGSAFSFGKDLVPTPFVRRRSRREGLVFKLKVAEAPFEDVCDVVRRSRLKVGFEFLK